MMLNHNNIFLLKKIPLLGIFIIIYSLSNAQQFNYFNYRYDINENGLQDDCSAIVETDDGFIISGSSLVVSDNIYWWEKKLTKLNYNGTVLYIKTYGEDSIDYFFSYYPGYLIEIDDNYFAVGKKRTHYPDGLHDEATLMYLDENLDTLWMKRYGEKEKPYDTAYLFSCLEEINQGNLIIAGAWKPNGLATHVYLLKTDSSGNKIWDKSYSYYNYYIEGTSVAQTTDSGYVIGCFSQIPGYPSTVDPVLIKTDSLGNQEWTKNLGGPYHDSNPMVSISFDGNIIVGTSYGDTMATPDNPISRINIIKLDNEGNVIWNRKYGTSERSKYLHNIRILSDGSIISVGSVYRFNPEPDRISWILKTSPEGDSIWYREYEYLSGYQSRNYLYDIIPTSDHGLIACGYVEPHPPDTGSTDTWVIKLDSIGCDTAGCDPTVWVPEEEKRRGGEEGNQLVLWPNPARTVLSVKVSGLSSGKSYSLVLYDIFGRSAPTPGPAPNRGKGEFLVDVSALPPGLYLVVLKDGLTVKASAKFVVVR